MEDAIKIGEKFYRREDLERVVNTMIVALRSAGAGDLMWDNIGSVFSRMLPDIISRQSPSRGIDPCLVHKYFFRTMLQMGWRQGTDLTKMQHPWVMLTDDTPHDVMRYFMLLGAIIWAMT